MGLFFDKKSSKNRGKTKRCPHGNRIPDGVDSDIDCSFSDDDDNYTWKHPPQRPGPMQPRGRPGGLCRRGSRGASFDMSLLTDGQYAQQQQSGAGRGFPLGMMQVPGVPGLVLNLGPGGIPGMPMMPGMVGMPGMTPMSGMSNFLSSMHNLPFASPGAAGSPGPFSPARANNFPDPGGNPNMPAFQSPLVPAFQTPLLPANPTFPASAPIPRRHTPTNQFSPRRGTPNPKAEDKFCARAPRSRRRSSPPRRPRSPTPPRRRSPSRSHRRSLSRSPSRFISRSPSPDDRRSSNRGEMSHFPIGRAATAPAGGSGDIGDMARTFVVGMVGKTEKKEIDKAKKKKKAEEEKKGRWRR